MGRIPRGLWGTKVGLRVLPPTKGLKADLKILCSLTLDYSSEIQALVDSIS